MTDAIIEEFLWSLTDNFTCLFTERFIFLLNFEGRGSKVELFLSMIICHQIADTRV